MVLRFLQLSAQSATERALRKAANIPGIRAMFPWAGTALRLAVMDFEFNASRMDVIERVEREIYERYLAPPKGELAAETEWRRQQLHRRVKEIEDVEREVQRLTPEFGKVLEIVQEEHQEYHHWARERMNEQIQQVWIRVNKHRDFKQRERDALCLGAVRVKSDTLKAVYCAK